MNIHTQREKEFMAKLLKLLKKQGVLLLKQSEIPEFVESHRPPKSDLPISHRLLGHLNADMCLLLAIAHYFNKEFMLVREKVTDDWREAMRGFSSYEISWLCNDAFWILMKERFREKVDTMTQGYVLQPDWSIHVVDRTNDLPWPDHPEILLSRLRGQSIAHQISRS